MAEAVRITEGNDTFYGVKAAELDDVAFFNRLSKEEKKKIITGKATVKDMRPTRDETVISGLDALTETTTFIRRWKSKVVSTEEARRAAAVQCLIDGEDPAKVQETVDVNFHVLTTWCHEVVDGKKIPLVEKSVLTAIAKAEKEAKKA